MGADMEFLFDLPVGVRAGPPRGVDIVGIATDDCKWIARDSENWTGLHPGHDWCFPNRQTFPGQPGRFPRTISQDDYLEAYPWTPPMDPTYCLRGMDLARANLHVFFGVSNLY